MALLLFTAVYLALFSEAFTPCGVRRLRREFLVVVVLGVALAVWLGPAWSGLLVYVSAAAAASLPDRWVWPWVVGAAVVCAAVLAAPGLLLDLLFLPVICVLTAFALRGTRYLISVNAELAEAREELARNAVVEERMRFARDLHDLLGHSLSLIALKSELAGRLVERDPARARAEMADVEAAARRALAEVRDAVSGYRTVSLAQALAEARSALSAANVTLRAPGSAIELPADVDAVLGWVVREATTNVLRHSGARTMTVDLRSEDDEAVLTVTDDGRGTAAPRGTGLSGLAERVAALGGRLESGPLRAGGFRLVAVLPSTAGRPAGRSMIRVLSRRTRRSCGGAPALLELEDDMTSSPRSAGATRSSPRPASTPRRGAAGHRDARCDGIEAARALATALPDCRAVILTTFGRPDTSVGRWRPGRPASSSRTPRWPSSPTAIGAVMAGERVIDRGLAAAALALGATPLSAREADVLRRPPTGPPWPTSRPGCSCRRERCATTCRRRSARRRAQPRRGGAGGRGEGLALTAPSRRLTLGLRRVRGTGSSFISGGGWARAAGRGSRRCSARTAPAPG